MTSFVRVSGLSNLLAGGPVPHATGQLAQRTAYVESYSVLTWTSQTSRVGSGVVGAVPGSLHCASVLGQLVTQRLKRSKLGR